MSGQVVRGHTGVVHVDRHYSFCDSGENTTVPLRLLSATIREIKDHTWVFFVVLGGPFSSNFMYISFFSKREIQKLDFLTLSVET